MTAANRSVGNLRLPPAERGALTHGLRYVVEFPVAPGRYQVRVAARRFRSRAWRQAATF